MYQALYRKYRPQRFDDVIGQSHITGTLQAQLAGGRVSHAYLFTGTRGTGKTTCAKLLARAVNCTAPENGNPCNRCKACMGIRSGAVAEVLELDAASNTGVDNMRALLEEVIYPPVEVKKRVYIVDEVHMLSIGAFNALLKTLEEPPAHVLFILATTELHKVPATILSRCQRFDFRRVDMNVISENLLRIAQLENLPLTPDAAALLGRLADGSVRDSLSLLERCMSVSGGDTLDEAAVYTSLGLSAPDAVFSLARALGEGDAVRALSMLDAAYADGRDLRSLLDHLASVLRDALVLKTAGNAAAPLLRTGSTDEIRPVTEVFDAGRLLDAVKHIQDTINGMQRSSAGRLEAEMCLMRLCTPSLSGPAGTADTDSLARRIASLEAAVKKTGVSRAVAQPLAAAPDGDPGPMEPAGYGTPPGADAPPWEDSTHGASPARSASPAARAPEAVQARPVRSPQSAPVQKSSILGALSDAQKSALLGSLSGKISHSAMAYLRLSKMVHTTGMVRVISEDEMGVRLMGTQAVHAALAEAAGAQFGETVRICVESEDSVSEQGFGGFDSIMKAAKDAGVELDPRR